MHALYFAQEPPYSPQLASRLWQKVDRWYEQLPLLRLYQRARRIRQAYYGLPSESSPFDVTVIGEQGRQGELSALNLNHLGPLGQRIHAMTVSNDLGWQPFTLNTDAASRKEAAAARAVLNYERRASQLDRTFSLAAETAFLDGSSWLAVRWDERGGDLYDRQPPQEPGGAPRNVYTGALRVTLHPWWRSVVDLYRHDPEHEWIILCDYRNKYDLIARYASLPKQEGLRNRLLGLPREHPRVLLSRQDRGYFVGAEETDLVPVWTLYHLPTESVPQGREVVFVDGGTILADSQGAPWVYGHELPTVRMAPGEWLDTPHGHTPLANLVAPQQALNMATSSDLTNIANGGVARLFVPTGANLKRTVMEDGAEIFEADELPQALATVGSHPATAKMAEFLAQQMVHLLGLNEAALGRQDRQMSGSLAALFDAKAREGGAPFIRSYRWAVEAVGTRILRTYKACARVPRTLEIIVGKDRGYTLDAFTGDQLGRVDRVTVEAQNGMLGTTSGQMALLESLFELPSFLASPRAPEIVLQVYTTGTIDPLVVAPETEDTLIQQENEWMREGTAPPVRAEDDHPKHIEAHRLLALNPQDRMDGAVMNLLEVHLADHRAAMAVAVAEEAAAMAPLPGAEPLPPPPGGPAPELAPLDAGPDSPTLPALPTNPATGEQAPSPMP